MLMLLVLNLKQLHHITEIISSFVGLAQITYIDLNKVQQNLHQIYFIVNIQNIRTLGCSTPMYGISILILLALLLYK